VNLRASRDRGFYRRHGKRWCDVAAAGIFLVVTLPIQGAVAVLVRTKLGTPVLFRQERPGLHGQPFLILKFRTMTDERDAGGKLLPDDVRLTRLGQLLRNTSLDEQPELWNVVKGDMSLVGPRPLLMKYLPLYTPAQARRHDVRPGVTGWAQVNGRNTAGWGDKLAMDTWYVDNVSFGLDVRILLRTVVAVFARRGISADGHATAPEFTGLENRSTP
jgi:lipopolysaccharide/colanic/teichoic acid biosynthesis glycosyltransferase